MKKSKASQHKQRDPFFTAMIARKKGAHKDKTKYSRKTKHKGKSYA